MNNRNDPIFSNTTNTNSLNLGITTFCSMNCPKCSISIPKIKEEKKAKHIKFEDLIEDLTTITNQGKLKLIRLTGGEPTIHPQFKKIVNTIAHNYSQFLVIETNGIFYQKHKSVFWEFDRVFITHYEKDAMYEGSPDNTEIIKEAENDLGVRLIRESPVTHESQHRTLIPLTVKETECSKAIEPGLPAGYYNRRLYSCCVSFGIDPELSMPVTNDWRFKIKNLNKGCNRCCYQGT